MDIIIYFKYVQAVSVTLYLLLRCGSYYFVPCVVDNVHISFHILDSKPLEVSVHISSLM